MKKKKPVYKIVDSQGRFQIPAQMRRATGIDCGDIVRLDFAGGSVSAKKVELIEMGDSSPEAVSAYVQAVVRSMDKGQLSDTAALILRQIEQV